MSTEAFIYEAIRTPRGRGKQTGSLHATKPVSLVVGLIDDLPTCEELVARIVAEAHDVLSRLPR